METKPTLAEFRQLAARGNMIPVCVEILADTETPVSAYMKLRSESGGYSFLFESVEGGERAARYSFLGIRPDRVFRSRDDRISLEEMGSGRREWRGDPVAALKDLIGPYEPVQVEGLPRFTGGAVGYLGYDGIRLVEDIPASGADDLELDDMVFAVFGAVLAFDNLRHTILLIANADLGQHPGDVDAAYEAAVSRLRELKEQLARPAAAPQLTAGEGMGPVRSNMSRRDYVEKIERCLEYIRAGDIFQVVFSQRFQVEVTADPLDIYRILRTVNPSPYMFHMTLGDQLQVLGASPEILVRVEGGTIDLRPIAGTRPRGKTAEEDTRLEVELLNDDKDRAEHVMLVDLGRNDVGRVSEFDSVELTEMMTVERYSHVMHIVSNVRGRLRPEMDSVDALFACYPAGTLSGAPKIRAMEIIDELESCRRGIYGGAIGYLDFSGNLDTCIAIRTLVVKDGIAYVQAGGGIVADSKPEEEYQETVNKAMALLRAIEMAERGSITPSTATISGLQEGEEPSFLAVDNSRGD